MRLRSLTLDRFGHFTDQKYDFGDAGERPDFHIIYGSNEAGKTTTMEAALRLLYGFPARESYAFKHPRNNLQISAQLDIDGQLRRFTRLPKRSGALLDEAGTALPEAALAAHLGGLSEADYRSLLCLDDETIERGGEEIAQAKGDIGRLLFSAAAGVSDLSSVLDNVRTKADALWRKRASKTRIAELKRDLAEVDKSIRDNDTSAGALRTLKKALRDSQATENETKNTRDLLLEHYAICAAQRRALPVLAEIDALTTRIAPFAKYPQHLGFDPERLVQLVAQESYATTEIVRLTAEIDVMAAALAAIEIAPNALDLNEQLSSLKDLSGRDTTARLDLDRRRDALRAAKTAMEQAAEDLGVAQGADLDTLVLSPADIARIETAREALKTIQAAAEAERLEVADLTERFAAAHETLEKTALDGSQKPSLTEILTRFDLDRLAPGFAQARHILAAAEAQASDTLRALGPQIKTVPPCPSGQIQAQDWAQKHSELAQSIAQTEVTLAQHLEDAAVRQAQAHAMMSTGGFISDAQAEDLQHQRNTLWQAHLREATQQTAQAFEEAMKALDGAVAARLSQASDLGRLRQIEQAHAEAQARADQTKIRLQALLDANSHVQTQVDQAAAQVGFATAILPAEWLDWVQAHARADAAAHNLSALRLTHQPVCERAAELLEVLEPHLPVQSIDFEASIAAARELAKAEQDKHHVAQKAQDTLTALEADLKRRKQKHVEKQNAAQDCAEEWRALVTSLLGDAVRPEALFDSLTPLRNLREQADKKSDVARRVALLEADQLQFLTLVNALADQHNCPQAETSAATFTALCRYAEAVRDAKAQETDVTTKLAKARGDLQDKQNLLADIARQVEAIGRVFPTSAAVETLDDLRQTVSQTQQVILNRDERAKLERTACADLNVDTLAEAQAQFSQTSLAMLEAQSAQLKADIQTAEQQMMHATEARVTAQQALAQVTGDAAIATLTERKATLELELEDAALEHLELALGHRIAEEAIRRYRDTHRSGMMAATERCFATLTQGAYPRLITQPDGENETLLAVDSHGTTKRAVDMSKGTRFQLYLALRAAAHEQLVTQGTCLPFFCDDIFETFDEDRTRAACRVMEQIGRSGQAIYLTHHRHVVEIAQKVCDTPPTVHYV